MFAERDRNCKALDRILKGYNSNFLVPATVVSQKTQLSECYRTVGIHTVDHVFEQEKRYCDYGIPFWFDQILVDGNQLIGAFTKESVTRKLAQSSAESIASTSEFHVLDVDMIKRLATPAPYGKGSDTVLDEKVRKAMEISADRLNVVQNHRFDFVTDTLKGLAPRGTKLVPKLYKLHVYEEGGMFLEHRDTIHADNHYATMIISLPTEYQGGEFVLEVAQGKKEEIKFNPQVYNECLVFLTDMKHQVLPVTSGHRVVLQYDVYLEKEETIKKKKNKLAHDPSRTSLYERETEWSIKLRDSKELEMTKKDFLSLVKRFLSSHRGDGLSFFLMHKYPLSLSSENLRGADRLVYELLSEEYYVELGLAVNSFESTYLGEFIPASMKSLRVMDYDSVVAFNVYNEIGSIRPTASTKRKSHVIVGNGVSFKQTLAMDYSEHTGNEAAPAEYAYVSFVLSVGPKKEVTRQRPVTSTGPVSCIKEPRAPKRKHPDAISESMTDLGTEIRNYRAFSHIITRKSSDFLVPATIVKQSNPLAVCYYNLGSETSNYIFEQEKHWGYAFLFNEITVDDNDVIAAFTKSTVAKKLSGTSEPRNYFVDIDMIKRLATPAPYGKGSDTVLDEKVRKAMEISADRLNVVQNQQYFDSVTDTLKGLAPRGTKLVPKLYKLHLYEEGGMFLEHRDTIHADNHYATMIISLPTEYQGGEFVLEVAQGKKEEIKFNPQVYNECLVFLTDMKHQVLPVTSGHRVVLQYDVYLEKEEKDKTNSDGECKGDEDRHESERDSDNDSESQSGMEYLHSTSLYQKEGLLLLATPESALEQSESSRKDFLPLVKQFLNDHPGERLSFFLTHEYPLALHADYLRGADRLVYELLSKEYHVELGLAVNAFETDYEGNFGSKEVKALHVMDYDSTVAFNEFIESGKNKSQTTSIKSHVVFGNGVSFEQTLATSYIEHTGNEAAPAEYAYVSVVLSVGPKKNPVEAALDTPGTESPTKQLAKRIKHTQ